MNTICIPSCLVADAVAILQAGGGAIQARATGFTSGTVAALLDARLLAALAV